MSEGAIALAALMVAGHALADFVFQTGWMVQNKNRLAGILAHGGVLILCQSIALLPFAGRDAAAAVGAVVIAHLALDRSGARSACSSRHTRSTSTGCPRS